MIQQLFFLKSFDLLAIFKAFGSFDFLILIGIVIFLIGMVFSVIYAFKSFIKRQEKANLMEEKVLPELISKFGKVISIEAANYDRSIQFERHGTIFDVKVTSTSDGSGANGTKNIVQFSLLNLREKFYIHHKSFFSSKTFEECQLVPVTMPDDFIFYSLNPQFLLDLMQNEKIRNEIYKYQKKYCNQFSIAFENSLLTVTWSPMEYEHESPHDEAQKLEQICQTAVIFYDELAKK